MEGFWNFFRKVMPVVLVGGPININNFSGLSREWVGVKIVSVSPSFLGKNKHINKIHRTTQESAGTVPGQSRDNPGTIPSNSFFVFRYRPKGVFGKGVGNSKNASEMRQKCVRNASKMRQNGSCFIGKRGTLQNVSEMRQNCVKNASKMRGTPLGENTFWTIPIFMSFLVYCFLVLANRLACKEYFLCDTVAQRRAMEEIEQLIAEVTVDPEDRIVQQHSSIRRAAFQDHPTSHNSGTFLEGSLEKGMRPWMGEITRLSTQNR